jgi:hypothetical protein
LADKEEATISYHHFLVFVSSPISVGLRLPVRPPARSARAGVSTQTGDLRGSMPFLIFFRFSTFDSQIRPLAWILPFKLETSASPCCARNRNETVEACISAERCYILKDIACEGHRENKDD